MPTPPPIHAHIIEVDSGPDAYQIAMLDTDGLIFGQISVDKADSHAEALSFGHAVLARVRRNDMPEIEKRLKTYAVRHVVSGEEKRFPFVKAS